MIVHYVLGDNGLDASLDRSAEQWQLWQGSQTDKQPDENNTKDLQGTRGCEGCVHANTEINAWQSLIFKWCVWSTHHLKTVQIIQKESLKLIWSNLDKDGTLVLVTLQVEKKVKAAHRDCISHLTINLNYIYIVSAYL